MLNVGANCVRPIRIAKPTIPAKRRYCYWSAECLLRSEGSFSSLSLLFSIGGAGFNGGFAIRINLRSGADAPRSNDNGASHMLFIRLLKSVDFMYITC